MIKVLAIFALVLVVSVQANLRCRPVCKRNVHSPAICAADNRQKICSRMSQCQLDEENCRRRASHRPTISNVAGIRCRNIKKPNGSGPCAKVHRPHRSVVIDCNRLKCHNHSKVLNCYSCKKNYCQRLTACQLQRINCRRGQSNRLNLTNARRCAGMKAGQALQKCKPVHNKG